MAPDGLVSGTRAHKVCFVCLAVVKPNEVLACGWFSFLNGQHIEIKRTTFEIQMN